MRTTAVDLEPADRAGYNPHTPGVICNQLALSDLAPSDATPAEANVRRKLRARRPAATRRAQKLQSMCRLNTPLLFWPSMTMKYCLPAMALNVTECAS